MKIYTTITPKPTTITKSSLSTTPLSSSISSQEQEELPSSSSSAVVVVMTPPSSPPLPTRKRPHIEATSSCKHDDDDEDKKSTPRPSSIISTTTASSSSRHNNKRQRTRKDEEPTITTTTTNVVRFAPTPHQTHIVPRWTTNESTNSWYSKYDLFTFRCQESVDASILRQLIQETPTIQDLPQESAVYRGLERLLSESIACEISDRRKLCVLNVLVAQLQGFDVEGIAQASMDCTEKAVAWALTFGSL